MQYCSSLLKHEIIHGILAAVYLTECNVLNMITYLMNYTFYDIFEINVLSMDDI